VDSSDHWWIHLTTGDEPRDGEEQRLIRGRADCELFVSVRRRYALIGRRRKLSLPLLLRQHSLRKVKPFLEVGKLASITLFHRCQLVIQSIFDLSDPLFHSLDVGGLGAATDWPSSQKDHFHSPSHAR
jgi:hypothetical protein